MPDIPTEPSGALDFGGGLDLSSIGIGAGVGLALLAVGAYLILKE